MVERYGTDPKGGRKNNCYKVVVTIT